MTFRTMNPEPFNAIAEHPEVRPWLGFADLTETPNLTGVISNPNNFAFLTRDADGGYLLLKLQPGLYAAHTLALPSARGKPMLKLMREGFSTMFRATDAVEIVSQVPDGNANAEGWSALAGFRNTFRREAFFPLMNELVGCQFKSLSFTDWALKDRDCRIRGEAFHSMLESAGHVDNHPSDPAHNAMVGAAIGCCLENNTAKGVGFFNRYAALAGYAQAEIISFNPPTVQTGNAVMQIEGGKMDILYAC